MDGMASLVSSRPITEAEWEAMADPPNGRYEILDGRLFVTPSPNDDHNRHAEDLADLLRRAVRINGLNYTVTSDVEWRVLGEEYVTEAPRGDVVVGFGLHPDKKIHVEVPVLVGEIWSSVTRPATIRERRTAWARLGVNHYWEVQLGESPEDAHLLVFDFGSQTMPIATATGDEVMNIEVPFAVAIIPALIHGWADRESQRADREAQRADWESRRADNEAQRADGEAQRAERAAERADVEEQRARQAARRAEQAERENAELRRMLGESAVEDAPSDER